MPLSNFKESFVLIVRQPSTVENDSKDEVIKNPFNLETIEDDFSENYQDENFLQVPQLRNADRNVSLLSLSIDPLGDFKWFYLIFPLIVIAFTVGIFFGGFLCKFYQL